MDPQHSHAESKHVNTATYWKIGVILTLITAVEVAVFYIEALSGPAILILLSVVKFVLVAMFFMHLKFDSPLYTRFFVAGLLMALATALAVVVIIQTGHTAALMGGA